MRNFSSITRVCYLYKGNTDLNEISIRLKQIPILTDVELYQNGTICFLVIRGKFQKEIDIEIEQVIDSITGDYRNKTLKNLELIFKKNIANKPQIKNEFQRIVVTLELENDPKLRSEYIEIHHPANIWLEIISNMNFIGIEDMELYLYKYRAFLLMDTKIDFDKLGKIWADLPREKEWQKYVSKFQKVNSNDKTIDKWIRMQRLK